jgi:hypothetical protein
MHGDTDECVPSPTAMEPELLNDAATWAAQQWTDVDLGDRRRNARALAVGQAMAHKPEATLPNQMADWAALRDAYRLLSNPAVTLAHLLAPHCQATLAAAAQAPLVLFVEDTSELDYTAHRSMTGLAPIGDGHGRGLLLHTTVALIPVPRHLVGVAQAEVVLRQPGKRGWKETSPEGRLWQASATAVGAAPPGTLWVHVSDAGSDDFPYLATCVDQGKHFLIRVQHNRILFWDPASPQATDPAAQHLLDYARTLPAAPGSAFPVLVRETKQQPARTAHVVLAWAPVLLPPPEQSPDDLVHHAPLAVWVLRIWEPSPPPEAEAVEWLLLTSVPTESVADVRRASDWWYPCRWLCEDVHQVLKTGLRIEHSQLDNGDDIQRLLGFCLPIAVRLLQLREAAQQAPDQLASDTIDPLMVQVLARRQQLEKATLTLGVFWRQVARLGGHLGRKSDGPPGWRTVWKGWRYLCDLTEGARLVVPPNTT